MKCTYIIGTTFNDHKVERKILRCYLRPLKMGPTAAPETSSGNLSCTPCRIPKAKNQYSFHGESLKSKFRLVFHKVSSIINTRVPLRGLRRTLRWSVESLHTFCISACLRVWNARKKCKSEGVKWTRWGESGGTVHPIVAVVRRLVCRMALSYRRRFYSYFCLP